MASGAVDSGSIPLKSVKINVNEEEQIYAPHGGHSRNFIYSSAFSF